MSRSGYHRDTWQPSGTTGRTQRHQAHHGKAMGTNGELKGMTCCLTKSDQCSSWFHWIPKEHLNCRCLIVFGRWWWGIFGDSWSSDFHPAAMTVEVVPFFARLAHASLEAIQYVRRLRGWEVGSRCNLRSMAPLPLFQFPDTPLEN